jgi:hypothetical protein
MLIPNKFNGYRRDGTRNLHIGGGIGEAALLEAMLTGAAVGGGSSLIQGKDPLQGALLGGLTGGAFSGISGALGGGAGEALSGAMPGATPAAVLPEAISAQTGSGLGAFNPDFAPLPGTSGMGAPGTSMLGSNPATQYASNLMPEFGVSAAPGSQGIMGQAKEFWGSLSPTQKLLTGGAGIAGLGMIGDQMRGGVPKKDPYSGPLSRFSYNPDTYIPWSQRKMADGGIAGGEIGVGYGPNPMFADGGIASLGGYSDGGRMLKGPGDGMSDNIPATIGGKQPARLADGEFVVPADVVSHLGNGSTDAGAKQLYSMMNKVRKARTGRKAQGREISPHRYMPA